MADRPRTAKPWLPAQYVDSDVYAIKALAAGTATPEQQKRALDWVIKHVAGTYDLSFRPTVKEIPTLRKASASSGCRL